MKRIEGCPAERGRKTLRMIGNAHLDTVWLWQWQEGFQEAKSTFRSVLNLMQEYEDFYFTSSSAHLYEWIEGNDPEMFEEIRRRVAEGRWEIAGGWWNQPDCNIPGGESFVRQGLYGQRYFKEKFGITATVGYNPDSFGHAGSLPQILRRSGLDSYVFTRPHPHERNLPSRLFIWESPDGSRVMAYRIPYEYCTWGKGLQQHIDRCAAELGRPMDELMAFYGVGNHGGGPTRENIESIHELARRDDGFAIRFGRVGDYFRDMAEKYPDLPAVQGELQQHAVGCYSAHSGVKRWNRQAENLLIMAEKWSAVAAQLTGLPYPCDFGRAWKSVLFNQFHDILAGTSIEPAYEDARNLYGEAMAIGARHLNSAVQSISWRIDIPYEEEMRPVVVFNPHAWPSRIGVEVEFARVADDAVLLDTHGEQVPFQLVRSRAAVSNRLHRRVSFLANLPPFGHTVYRLVRRPGATPPPASVEAGDTYLENERFRVEFDAPGGGLFSLYDKREQFEWLRAPARALVLNDRSDTWSHDSTHFDDVAGAFTVQRMRCIERGPVRSTIRVESTYGNSHLTQDFTVYPDLDRIDVRATVDWREHFKMLKLSFPLNLFYTTITYEAPYGVVTRPGDGREVPGQSWVDITGMARNNGTRMGLSLINDGKYSFDATEKVLSMTVLRSPIYAHHVPYEPVEGEEYVFVDGGVQHFAYSLLPHTGGWEEAGTVQRAAELNAPPTVLVESAHPGPLPQEVSYLSADDPAVAVTAVKGAEDGDGTILRCLETVGRPAVVTICMPAWGRQFRARFGPWELKTFRVPNDPDAPVMETDLTEWNDREL